MTTGTSNTFTAYPATKRIGKTLADASDRLVDNGATTALCRQEESELLPLVEGLVVSAGTFPKVTVAAGSLTGLNGELYRIAGGELSLTPVPGGHVDIFLNKQFQVEAGVIPASARYFLGRAHFNADGTAFSAISPATLEEVINEDALGRLVTVEVANGPLILLVAGYTYSEEGLPTLMVEHAFEQALEYRTTFDGTTGLPAACKTSEALGRPFWLTGAFALDGALDLDGANNDGAEVFLDGRLALSGACDLEGREPVPFARNLLIANGTRLADGFETADGTL